jgi:hypothetical protein
VKCPTCNAEPGSPCVSRHTIARHQFRAAAPLVGLETQATAMITAGKKKGEKKAFAVPDGDRAPGTSGPAIAGCGLWERPRRR